MSDFTKEELIGLFYMIDSFIRYCEGGKKALTMRAKILSLIDNYCEHDLQPTLGHAETSTRSDDVSMDAFKYSTHDFANSGEAVVQLKCKVCEHESDEISESGLVTGVKGDINRPLECKKCGEFYR